MKYFCYKVILVSYITYHGHNHLKNIHKRLKFVEKVEEDDKFNDTLNDIVEAA